MILEIEIDSLDELQRYINSYARFAINKLSSEDQMRCWIMLQDWLTDPTNHCICNTTINEVETFINDIYPEKTHEQYQKLC